MNNSNRIEMIKAAAEKLARRKALSAKFGASAIGKLTNSMDVVEAREARKAADKKFNEQMDALNECEQMYWQDASSFVKNSSIGEAHAESSIQNEWN